MSRGQALSIARVLVVLAFPVCVVGCGGALVGTWRSEAPVKDAEFSINNVTFKDNGTYTASARRGEQDVRLNGKYEFNGFRLSLKGRNPKDDRVYDAMVNSFTSTLEISKDGKKQALKKQE